MKAGGSAEATGHKSCRESQNDLILDQRFLGTKQLKKPNIYYSLCSTMEMLQEFVLLKPCHHSEMHFFCLLYPFSITFWAICTTSKYTHQHTKIKKKQKTRNNFLLHTYTQPGQFQLKTSHTAHAAHPQKQSVTVQSNRSRAKHLEVCEGVHFSASHHHSNRGIICTVQQNE